MNNTAQIIVEKKHDYPINTQDLVAAVQLFASLEHVAGSLPTSGDTDRYTTTGGEETLRRSDDQPAARDRTGPGVFQEIPAGMRNHHPGK